MLIADVLKHFQDTFKELYKFSTVCLLVFVVTCFEEYLASSLITYLVAQMMANRSREKSYKLKAIEDGLCQLQAKDHQIEDQIMKKVELQNQVDAIKLECAREV
jgi:uncharacterized membrane protein SpoIIM required for sporulation